MRKTDFQLESELSGSLRQMKNQNSLLEERFDDLFRRNLLAPEAKVGDSKKRLKKAQYKFHKSRGEKGQAEELHEENLKKKKEREAKS
mmetsp:Transcript_10132/g.7603  ORF Transcript_10132/g.7603 Transcript_10132/m.7603 type:complete len:88 (-) Transcript_10132:53-316(-)